MADSPTSPRTPRGQRTSTGSQTAKRKQLPVNIRPSDKGASLDSRCTVSDGLKPASVSMFMTSLKHKEVAPEPKMAALERVHEALHRDALEQVKKYGTEEPDSQSVGRYTVQLPRSPQHEKYSWIRPKGIDDEEGDEEVSETPHEAHSMRFNIVTLRNWFKDIDHLDTGLISQRELIVAIRKQKGLVDLLCAEPGQRPGAASPSEDPPKRVGDVQRIRKTLAQVTGPIVQPHGPTITSVVHTSFKESHPHPTGSVSDKIQLSEFIDFFRKAGLLLEYKTQKQRNRATLMGASLAFDQSQPSMHAKASFKAKRMGTSHF